MPTVGQVSAGKSVTHSALPFRAYNLVWNQWFRDENLQPSVKVDLGDGPDNPADYVLLKRGKRHDYFTSCLPWAQKGNAVSVPLTGNAPIITGTEHKTGYSANDMLLRRSDTGAQPTSYGFISAGHLATYAAGGPAHPSGLQGLYPSNLYADLSAVTATTINALRQAFQLQRLLERDARGGSRYTEIVRSHFNVVSPDARMQRPEYLGALS